MKKLSPKYGLNPTIPVCYFCNKPKNEIILAGHLKSDVEAPQNVVWDKNPCEECEAHMKAGVILISVRDGEKGDNPYRTGGWIVIREEAFRRISNEKTRVAFVEDSIWNQLQLPR